MVLKVEDEKNLRIDKYLSLKTTYSREIIIKMLNAGFILVNGTQVKPSYKIKENDEITIDESFITPLKLIPEDIPLDIVYEDSDVLVINKPSGLIVHPGNGNNMHTLVNTLLFHYPDIAKIGETDRPGIVHRLDKDTSGLMLVAKSQKAYDVLIDDFKNKRVHREYVALLQGVFPHQKATVEAPIGRDKNHFDRYVVSSDGKWAKTTVEVLKKYPKYTLVKLVLATGRTHQIRVHMAYIGYPVFNDPLYTKQKCTDFGQFLHSHVLEFTHPVTGKVLTFEVPVPHEFQDFLDKIEEDEKEHKVS